VTPAREILHVDMDAFYAAVEQLDRPELRGLPVIVGAPPDRRGVVATCSYEARAFGVRSAMPSREAARLCPQGVFLPCDMARYAAVSRQVMAIFERFTPLVEPVSIDEAFLDVSGGRRLFGDGAAIAARIRAAIRDELRLTASVGVAGNKFLAKLCGEIAKPDGLLAAPRTREEIVAFLAPLPVGRLWGVGKVLKAQLAQHGYQTIGDLQRAERARLETQIGRHTAGHLLQLAFGDDPREVETSREEATISREHTFDVDCRDAAQLERTLRELVDDVGRRLRADGRFATVGRLKLRWSDFSTITRQQHLKTPTDQADIVYGLAIDLLHRNLPSGQLLRLLGLAVSDLIEEGGYQLSLLDSNDQKQIKLSRAVDLIRERYGRRAISRASLLRRSRHDDDETP